MSSRLEYLTLAMANAKAHSASGHQGAAVQLLEVLEEKLDVYQVQAEMFNTLSPHMKDAPEVGQKIQLLSKYLMNMTEVRLPDIIFTSLHMTVYVLAIPRLCCPFPVTDPPASLHPCFRL